MIGGATYRTLCVAPSSEIRAVFEQLRAESTITSQDTAGRREPHTRARQEIEGGVTMSDDEMELVHGSGNVFRDFGAPDAEVLQLKAILAGKIIDVLDEQKISVRRAQKLTGYAAADFSRVRQAKLQRFTLDRLIAKICKLGQDVEVYVN